MLAPGLASPSSRVPDRRPQGLLVVGAAPWVRDVAAVLQKQGTRVVLVDSNWGHLPAALMAALPAVYSSVVSQYVVDELDLGGLGRLLAVQHFSGLFGRAHVYQLAPDTEGRVRSGVAQSLTGRVLFGSELTYSALSRRFERGAAVKVTRLTEAFTMDSFRAYYGDAASVLFVIEPSEALNVVAEDARLTPRAGHTLISIVDADQAAPATPA